MPKNPLNVDEYLLQGCMRCNLGGTPDCKVHLWSNIIIALRDIVLSFNLQEEIKWGVPTYTWNGKNILNLSAFKSHAALAFFKGALIQDSKDILVKPGERSQASRYLKFTALEEVSIHLNTIKDYIAQAIEIEQKGLKINFNVVEEAMPIELAEALKADSFFESAFFALTPGRQRGYKIFIAQAKQKGTRQKRVEACKPKIMQGVGLHDKYQRKK